MTKYAQVILLWMLILITQGFAADRPAHGYRLQDGKNYTFISPNKKFRVEQYALVAKDGYWHWQFWVFNAAHDHGCLLNAKPMADYGAGFRFSPDSRWLVRMQKIGGGWATLYLYQRHGLNFTEATTKPLGEMAWDYYESVRKALKLPEPNDHISADLVKGYDENYRWLGYDWPAGRYLIIHLSSDNIERSFACVYDTKSQKFFIPNDLETKRAQATQKKQENDPAPSEQ